MPSLVRAVFPDWDVPAHVHALVTLRTGGFSHGNYQGFNLATHVGDNLAKVSKNRQLLQKQFNLPTEPYWLEQLHGTKVVELPLDTSSKCDAAWTRHLNTVCTVLTADCLAVFFYHSQENTVAVAHAGWRGLLSGIIENTISQMTLSPEHLQVWLGPAIGAEKFIVGKKVQQAFCDDDADAEKCFIKSNINNSDEDAPFFNADIYQLARGRLYNAGVEIVTGGDYCTLTETQSFFSYRRDGKTGRMANLIWLTES